MKCSRKAGLWLMLLSCIAVAGCRATSGSKEPCKIAGYEVRASARIERSLFEPALRAALADPEVRANPERFPLVRVERIPDKAPAQAIRVEFQGYMEGCAVTLTNSALGWRVASVGRMIE